MESAVTLQAPKLRLVLASNNAKKLKELGEILTAGDSAAGEAGLPLALVAQGELGIGEADEPYGTFVENALAKARAAARASGCAALADDSGLCVPALGGAPGVVSAHYAGLVTPGPDREATRRLQDAANNRRLLQELQPHADRSAWFVCTLVALRHAGDPEPLVAVGRWPGRILIQPQGDGGFGYDPLMFIPALGATVAELSALQKNALSHRAQAAAQLKRLLRASWWAA